MGQLGVSVYIERLRERRVFSFFPKFAAITLTIYSFVCHHFANYRLNIYIKLKKDEAREPKEVNKDYE